MSKIEIAKISDVQAVDTKVNNLHTVAKTGSYADLTEKPTIPAKVTKTSELTNDSGYITANDIPPSPAIPTKLSELNNDVGFITEVNGSQVQATVEGLTATDVQGMIAELKSMIDALSAT